MYSIASYKNQHFYYIEIFPSSFTILIINVFQAYIYMVVLSVG